MMLLGLYSFASVDRILEWMFFSRSRLTEANEVRQYGQVTIYNSQTLPYQATINRVSYYGETVACMSTKVEEWCKA